MVELPEGLLDDDNKVIKELFGKKDLDFKTDLTPDQIVEICKLRHLYDKYKIEGINSFINNFLALQVSKKRKGRSEFIDAFKAEREAKKERDLFGLNSAFK